MSTKFLAIATNEGTMEKINQLKFLFNTPDNNVQFKVTDYNQFLEGKTIASFDYCMICSFAETTEDDIEMQSEMYDHYLNAPVSAVFATAGALSLNDSLKEKVIKEWTWDHIEPQDAVTELKKACSELAEMCEQKKNDVVKPAFDKYDKDASGNIDREELGALSADLGQPLDEEQLDAALADLDLNKDGVIDFSEFCRWYFSGMKSYSGQKRTLLKFKNGASILGKALLNPELVAAINADKSTVTQTLHVSFNEPADPRTTFKAKYNLFGTETTKWTQKALAFRTSKGAANPSGADPNQRVGYLKYEITNVNADAWNEIKPQLEKLMDSPLGAHALASAGLAYDVEHTGEKITIQFSVMSPEGMPTPEVPAEIAEALAEVDNNVTVQFKLATSPGEIMSNEKPISECLLGGFSYNVDLTYLKNIKKMGAVLPEKGQEMCAMFGPAFKLGVKANINLKFEDAEDLKEHPMIGDKFDLKFDDIFSMIGADKATFQNYELDMSGADESKAEDPQMNMLYTALKMSNSVSKLLRGFQDADGKCCIEVDAVVGGVMHVEVKAKTEGVGELYQMGFNAATMGQREQLKGMFM